MHNLHFIRTSFHDLLHIRLYCQDFDRQKKMAVDLYKKKKSRIQADIEALQESKKKFDAASSSIKTVLAVIDPNQIKAVLSRGYSAILSTLAVTKSQNAQKVARGLHFGNVLQSKFVHCLLCVIMLLFLLLYTMPLL